MTVHQIIERQFVPATVKDAWDFLSSPENLRKITPEYMGFRITSKEMPDKMYPGMIITYRVSPVLKMSLTWVTEITHMQEGSYFVDEQRIGPYRMWHHEHFIEPVEGGVVMRDIVTYKLPLGFIGSLIHSLFVKRQLKEIFAHRKKALESIFGTL